MFQEVSLQKFVSQEFGEVKNNLEKVVDNLIIECYTEFMNWR